MRSARDPAGVLLKDVLRCALLTHVRDLEDATRTKLVRAITLWPDMCEEHQAIARQEQAGKWLNTRYMLMIRKRPDHKYA